MSSIGVDFKVKKIEIDDKLIKMQIWDTAGHEKFRTITTSYYKSAHAILILYDITEEASFEHIKNWMIEIDKFGKQGVMRILVGNKNDLEDQRQISKEQGEGKAKSFNMAFLETSALSGENLDKAFQMMVNEVYKKCHSELEGEGGSDIMPGKDIELGKDDKKEVKKNCCQS